MPVNYRIDGDVVTIYPVGVHSTGELRAAWLAAEADAAYPSPITSVRICVDARASESLAKRSVTELRETAHWFSQRALATSRICAFITRSGVQYGLTRMMAAWIEYKGYSAFVTTNPQEAINWLNSTPHVATR